MAAQTKRYEITDEEWERIKRYFPERTEGQKGSDLCSAEQRFSRKTKKPVIHLSQQISRAIGNPDCLL